MTTKNLSYDVKFNVRRTFDIFSFKFNDLRYRYAHSFIIIALHNWLINRILFTNIRLS